MDSEGVEWKLKYKRMIDLTYQELSKEHTFVWTVQGVPDTRMRTFQCGEKYKVQGIMYCRATHLFKMWQDVDFERRKTWDKLIAPDCETVVESFLTKTKGDLFVVKHAHGYRLVWWREVPASKTYIVIFQSCPYRLAPAACESTWIALCILALDDDPEYGHRCYIRLITHNEGVVNVLEQLNVCEKLCRDPVKWKELYSEEAMRKRDAERRL